MNRIVINIPKSSPENLVNLFRIAAALNIAMRNNITEVQMQTLSQKRNYTYHLEMNDELMQDIIYYLSLTIQPMEETFSLPGSADFLQNCRFKYT